MDAKLTMTNNYKHIFVFKFT